MLSKSNSINIKKEEIYSQIPSLVSFENPFTKIEQCQSTSQNPYQIFRKMVELQQNDIFQQQQQYMDNNNYIQTRKSSTLNNIPSPLLQSGQMSSCSSKLNLSNSDRQHLKRKLAELQENSEQATQVEQLGFFKQQQEQVNDTQVTQKNGCYQDSKLKKMQNSKSNSMGDIYEQTKKQIKIEIQNNQNTIQSLKQQQLLINLEELPRNNQNQNQNQSNNEQKSTLNLINNSSEISNQQCESEIQQQQSNSNGLSPLINQKMIVKETKNGLLYMCSKKSCTYTTSKKAYMQKHYQRTHSEIVYNCKEKNCNYKTKTKEYIHIHMKSKHNNYFHKCLVQGCDFQSDNKSDLFAHKRENHEIRCDFCNKPFYHLANLQNHVQSIHQQECQQQA